MRDCASRPPDIPSGEESRWISLAKHGDQAAFEQLVLRYEKKVYSLALRLCGNPDDAQEAAQEAFVSAWQGLAFFRGDASFSTWLYRLTSNACMDLLRREQRHRSAAGASLDDEAAGLDVPDRGSTPQEEAERAELRRALERGLLALPAEYRAPLVLRELRQLTYDEIAAALELDLGTVKSRINRGRKQLRKWLSENGNFFPAQPSKAIEKGAANEIL